MEKDMTLFGSMAYDTEHKQTVVVLYTWLNIFADAKIYYAKVVGKNQCKTYGVEFDKLMCLED